jgi:hypothetical protein
MQYAVLVEVGADWPEVIFAGDHAEALHIAARIPEGVDASVQAIVTPEEAIAAYEPDPFPPRG